VFTGIDGCAEVEEDDPSSSFPHHVGRLHVTMDEPRTVYSRQGVTEIDADDGRLVRAERSVVFQAILQSLAFQQVGPQPYSILASIRSVDDEHVRVPHTGQLARLVEESRFACPIVVGASAAKQFEGNFYLKRRIVGPIDFAE
jgi:hypothetical protein